ncbi:MAG: rSAM-modified peptide [Cytophagales bacterium]|nr:MAG: rSAM-modified peptide [Cytophagales bacterium]
MKTLLSRFSGTTLSKEQMKTIKGGQVSCSYTACWGSDCFNVSGSCSSSDPDECTWMASCGSCSSISNIKCHAA